MNPTLFNKKVEQASLDLYEERLLMAYAYAKNLKYDQAIELLGSFVSQEQIVEGARLYLLGLCHYYTSDFYIGLKYSRKAFKTFDDQKDHIFYFQTIYNLSIIYFLQKDFKQGDFFLFEMEKQLKHFEHKRHLYFHALVIKFLRMENLEQAYNAWRYLQAINPKVYQDKLEYCGEFCFFKKYLLYCKDEVSHNSIYPKLSLIESPTDKLLYILSNSSEPLSKEKLALLVWNEKLDQKVENRLKKQISRLRQNGVTNIQQSKGQYWMES